MKAFYTTVVVLFSFIDLYAQNVGIGTTTPTSNLEIKKTIKSTVKISSSNFSDTSQLMFSNRNTLDQGTSMLISSNREEGLRISSSSDLSANNKDTIMQITATGNVGIRTATPAFPLDVKGNMNVTGEIKTNGTGGVAGDVLTSNGNGTMQWTEAKSNGGVGFGSWGDCTTNNISEYNPVTDASGAANDKSGSSVAISGNYAIVGAPLDDIGANIDQGSISLYQYNGVSWILLQKITDATGSAGDQFGISVSISGNYANVGAFLDDVGANVDQGSISIYQLSGGNWVFMQKIIDATGLSGDQFGSSVSISGSYVIIGSPFVDILGRVNQGAINIFQLSGGSWVYMVKAIDGVGQVNDNFGSSVSISGNYAIVGSPYKDEPGNIDQGDASIFQLSGGAWTYIQKITGGSAGDRFGTSASISGNYLIVGLPNDDVGSNLDQGSVIIYQLNGSTWVPMQGITQPIISDTDNFGTSVSISGNYVIIGHPNEGIPTIPEQGSATIYQRIGLRWNKVQYFKDPSGASLDYMGSSISIDGTTKRFLIGAPGYGGGSGTAIFGKINL
jgi:FG-GAP repeat